MSVKALRLKIKQPSAHYRDPKVFQNEYISTLNLPTRTTIMGMITYICERRLKSNVEIGVIGTHKNKELEFSRGERIEFWNDYKKLKKGKDVEKYLIYGEYYDYYKNFVSENSILNYEVLKNVELSIYFTCDDENEFRLVNESLNNPSRYMNLGRKEDFIIPCTKGFFVEEVELKEQYIRNSRDAIKNKLKIRNSYIKVDLKESEKYKSIINQGSLMALPCKYKDLEANKDDRVIEFSHYIYVGEDGIFPSNINVNVYETEASKEVFTWL